MANHEQAVCDAALKLYETIQAAKKEGFVITWPATVDALQAIPVSAGKRALTPDEIGAAAKAQAERDQRAAVDPVAPQNAASGIVPQRAVVMPEKASDKK